MKKPDFVGLATQTWKEMRRFPTSDALADAVLIKALFQLLMTPFSFQKCFPLKKSKWNGLLLLLNILLMPPLLFWRFNLSLRLRRNEKKAWRTTIIYSSVCLLLCTNNLLVSFWMRKPPREATEKDLEHLTETQRAASKANWAKLQKQFQERPWQSPWTPRLIAWHFCVIALTGNVLFRALQPSTRALFRSES